MGIIQRQGLINSIISYTGLALGALSLLIIQPHFLTKEEIGLTRVLFSFSSLMATFTSLGMNSITLKFFPYFRNKENGHHGYFGLMMIMPTIGFLFFGAGLFLAKGFVMAKYQEQSQLFTDYFYYVFPLTFFLTFINVLVAYAYSNFRTSVPALINDVLVRIVSMVFFTVYFIKWITLSQFIFLFVSIYGLQFISLIIYLYKIDTPSLSVDRLFLAKQNVSAMIGYGAIMSIASLSSIGLKFLDAVMLGMYKPKEAGLSALDIVGIYSIAAFVATIVEAPLNALEKIAVPQIANSWAKNDLVNIADIYHKSSKYLFLLGGILFVLINVNIEFLFQLMPDKDFSLGQSIVFIISLGTLVNMATGTNDAIISTSSKYKYIAYLLASLFVVAFINYLVFIPLFGMKGAALATALSFSLFNIAKFLLIWRFFKLQPFTYQSLKIVLLIIVLFLVGYFIPKLNHPLFNIFARTTVVIILSAIYIYLSKLVPELIDPLVGKIKNKWL